MINTVNKFTVPTIQKTRGQLENKPDISFKSSLTRDVFVRTAPEITFTAKHQSGANDKTVEYYDDNVESYFKSTKALAGMNEVYEPFLALIPAGGHILDAGCGSGRDSKNFKDKGYQITSFDASKPLAKKASEFIGQEVLHMKFNEVKDINKYDGIWACASLLHVPKVEVDESLISLSKALKPGGILYASFKDGNEESMDSKGRFFSYYDEAGLKELISRHKELELVKIWKNGDTLNRKGTVWNNILVRKKHKIFNPQF
jgi:SAM-dependent methyltransferase